MANGRRGFFRDIILRLDRRAAEQVQTDVQDALDRAGKSGAEALEEAMEQGGTKAAWTLRRILTDAYNQTIAEARVKFARGLIDQREFGRIRTEAARTFDQGLIAGMDRLRQQGDLTERQFRSLSRSLKGVGQTGAQNLGLAERALGKIRSVALSATGAIAGLFAVDRIRRFISATTDLAARYDTARVVLLRVGQNAGYTAEQLDHVERALQRTGISMIRSRETAASLISSNIELAHATDLARLAQDAAVIAQTNSSEAFDRLIQGISTGNVQILRNLGLSVNFQQAYQRTAQQLGKAVSELTEYERIQARTNAVMEAGAGIAGTYADAMDTAGKQAGSNVRLFEDLQIKIGRVFLPAYREAVFRYADALKEVHGWLDQITDEDIEEWGRRTARVIEAIVWYVRLSVRWIRLLVGWADKMVSALVALVHVGISVVQEALAGLASGFAVALDAAAKFQEFIGRSEGAARAREQAEAIREWADAVRGAAKISREAARISLQGDETGNGGGRQPPGDVSLGRGRTQGEAGPTAEERRRAIEAELRALEQGHRLGVLTADERVRALELEREISAELARGSLALEDRIRLTQQLQKLREIAPTAEVGELADSMGVTRPGWERIDPQPIRHARAEVDELAGRWLEVNAGMVDAAQNAAYGIAGSFQDMFGVLLTGFDNVGDAAEAMARGVAGSLLGGVAEYASGKVKENVALAIEATAKGLAAASNPFTAGLAPGFYQAAKTHALAAAKWGLLAGASGAGQSAVAGGGRGGLSGGIPTGARDTGGRLLEERRGPEVHIYIDPLDPGNPAWQRAVYAAGRYATDRYGEGAHVSVHPRTGGR